MDDDTLDARCDVEVITNISEAPSSIVDNDSVDIYADISPSREITREESFEDVAIDNCTARTGEEGGAADEFDIYTDFISSDYISEVELKKEEEGLKNELTTLKIEQKNLLKRKHFLCKKKQNLMSAYSSFVFTARAEIKRLDSNIDDLRKKIDNMIFRRTSPTLLVDSKEQGAVHSSKDKDSSTVEVTTTGRHSEQTEQWSNNAHKTNNILSICDRMIPNNTNTADSMSHREHQVSSECRSLLKTADKHSLLESSRPSKSQSDLVSHPSEIRSSCKSGSSSEHLHLKRQRSRDSSEYFRPKRQRSRHSSEHRSSGEKSLHHKTGDSFQHHRSREQRSHNQHLSGNSSKSYKLEDSPEDNRISSMSKYHTFKDSHLNRSSKYHKSANSSSKRHRPTECRGVTSETISITVSSSSRKEETVFGGQSKSGASLLNNDMTSQITPLESLAVQDCDGKSKLQNGERKESSLLTERHSDVAHTKKLCKFAGSVLRTDDVQDTEKKKKSVKSLVVKHSKRPCNFSDSDSLELVPNVVCDSENKGNSIRRNITNKQGISCDLPMSEEKMILKHHARNFDPGGCREMGDDKNQRRDKNSKEYDIKIPKKKYDVSSHSTDRQRWKRSSPRYNSGMFNPENRRDVKNRIIPRRRTPAYGSMNHSRKYHYLHSKSPDCSRKNIHQRKPREHSPIKSDSRQLCKSSSSKNHRHTEDHHRESSSSTRTNLPVSHKRKSEDVVKHDRKRTKHCTRNPRKHINTPEMADREVFQFTFKNIPSDQENSSIFDPHFSGVGEFSHKKHLGSFTSANFTDKTVLADKSNVCPTGSDELEDGEIIS